jgi:type III pantothenate kinase
VDDLAELWLTVDRGNTTLDCMLRGGGADERARLRDEPAALKEFLRGRRPARAAASTVVDGGLRTVEAELAAVGVPLWCAGVELACPLELAYPDPRTLGTDRWVAAVAARARFGDAVVVDCGTALTVGAVTADGRFLGGAIAPGVRAMAQGLAARAPALPLAGPNPDVAVPAITTRAAVEAGVNLGFAGMVDRLVADLAAAAGLAHAVAVLTGGDLEVARRLCRTPFQLAPDLVHEGLRWLIRARVSSC